MNGGINMAYYKSQKHSENSKNISKSNNTSVQVKSNISKIMQMAKINPKALSKNDYMQLQKKIGYRELSKMIQSNTVQREEKPEEEEVIQGKFNVIQREEKDEEEELPIQGKFDVIQKKNNTGMPDNLKTGIENLSGLDMSDVKVHYNSDRPQNVGALAYTQGTDIHVAPGQEKHIAHEAWHVVQQAQGRVQPTTQLKDVAINDDAELENEADVMGEKALQEK
jgi:hypothetical protein